MTCDIDQTIFCHISIDNSIYPFVVVKCSIKVWISADDASHWRLFLSSLIGWWFPDFCDAGRHCWHHSASSEVAGQTELLTKNCGKKTGQEPVLDQIRWRKWKWNWLGHTLRRNDERITKHVHTIVDTTRPRRKRATREYLEKRSGERNVDKYSWRKMEAAAQDRAGWRQVVCGLCSTGSD